VKIYSLIPEQKRYTIHNHYKPNNVKQYELEKHLNKAIETIIKTKTE
ncbi:12325_t:CDS:1, partial [Dentiscutata heterogama]